MWNKEAENLHAGSVRIVAAVSVIVLAATLAVLWLCFGSMTQTVSLKGLVFPQSGIRKVYAPAQGTVSQVLVNIGDIVEKGDILAVIPQQQLIMQMQTAGADKQALQQQYAQQAFVKAPVSGKVSQIVNIGQTVQQGETVIQIIGSDSYINQCEIRGYIPAAVAQRLRQGMQVEVSPDFAPRERYGYIEGFINAIGTLPVTHDQIAQELSGFQLPVDLADDESIVEVRITLVGNQRTDGSATFLWKDDIEVDTGTVCDVVVITQKTTPLGLLNT